MLCSRRPKIATILLNFEIQFSFTEMTIVDLSAIEIFTLPLRLIIVAHSNKIPLIASILMDNHLFFRLLHAIKKIVSIEKKLNSIFSYYHRIICFIHIGRFVCKRAHMHTRTHSTENVSIQRNWNLNCIEW